MLIMIIEPELVVILIPEMSLDIIFICCICSDLVSVLSNRTEQMRIWWSLFFDGHMMFQWEFVRVKPR